MPRYQIVHSQSTVDSTETWCGENVNALPKGDYWTADQHVYNFDCGACHQARKDYERAQEVIKHVRPSPGSLSGLSSAIAEAFAPELVKALDRPSALGKILSSSTETDTPTDDKGK